MASSKKVCNLAEAIDFVLDSDNEYSEDLSSNEQINEECDNEECYPCYRVSLNFLSILCCHHCHHQFKTMKLY